MINNERKEKDDANSDESSNDKLKIESTGLPGLRGADHMGFTVPNLEQAVDFFVNVIGCEPFYQLGPFQSKDDWMQIHLNVHRDAVMKKLQFLRCGNGSNFELFEYESPDQSRHQPKNSDFGGHHIAFYVDNIHESIAYLKSKGVSVLGEPTERTTGPNGGQAWVYFLSPWNMQLELVSYPKGKEYEKHSARKLWHPAYPER